jgi:hypothetical protein
VRRGVVVQPRRDRLADHFHDNPRMMGHFKAVSR